MNTQQAIELDARTERVRQLNDEFRQTFKGGQVLMTRGIQAMDMEHMLAIVTEVQSFTAFTEDNDPHGEHDFGAIDYEGSRIFWKIDYYAPDMMHGSEDPADPEQTRRMMTIMLASEY
jgi:hypothetical protein